MPIKSISAFASTLLLALPLFVIAPSSAQAAWAVASDGWFVGEIRSASTEAKAKQNALAKCQKQDAQSTKLDAQFGDRGNCKIVGSGASGCVAIARRAGIFGVGVAEKQSDAVKKAVLKCMSKGGSRCVVKIRFCS